MGLEYLCVGELQQAIAIPNIDVYCGDEAVQCYVLLSLCSGS